MAVMNRQVILAARPEGVPQESDFKLVERPLPPLHDGTFLARTEFFSVDPYMRMRISDESYAEPTNIGDVMLGGAVGAVVESKHPDYHPGDAVAGEWGWQEYAVSDGKGVRRAGRLRRADLHRARRAGHAGHDGVFRPAGDRPPERGRDGVHLRRGRRGRLAGRPDRAAQGLPRLRLDRLRREGRLPGEGTALRRRVQPQGGPRLRGEARGALPERAGHLLRQRGRPGERRGVREHQRRRADRACAGRFRSTTTAPWRAGRGCSGGC